MNEAGKPRRGAFMSRIDVVLERIDRDLDAMRAQLRPAPGDDALAAKVSWQINRMTLIMCGALVPGVLLFIAYDIHAGPLISVLKWLAAALMLGSMAITIVGNKRPG